MFNTNDPLEIAEQIEQQYYQNIENVLDFLWQSNPPLYYKVFDELITLQKIFSWPQDHLSNFLNICTDAVLTSLCQIEDHRYQEFVDDFLKKTHREIKLHDNVIINDEIKKCLKLAREYKFEHF